MTFAVATNPSQVNESYRYWRLHLMAAMYIGYGVFYFTRKSLSFAMPAMLSDLGTEHSRFWCTRHLVLHHLWCIEISVRHGQ